MKTLTTALFFSLVGLSATSIAADDPAPVYAAKESDFDKRMAAGRAAVKSKSSSQAIAAFSDAVKLEPRNADAHTMLAYSYRVQATPNLAKSFEHYDIALKLDPLHKGANEYVGQAHLRDNNVAKARQHLAALEKICGKQCLEYKNLEAAITSNRPNNNYGY